MAPFSPYCLLPTAYSLEARLYRGMRAWPVASVVRIAVFDVLGCEVAVLVNGWYPPGKHSFTFQRKGLPSGIHDCRLTAGMQNAVRTMCLIK